MVSEVEDRIIGIGSGFEIEDYWKPGQKIRKMVSQPITPPAGVTPEIRILEKSQDFRGLIVKHSFSLRSRRGVRQKFGNPPVPPQIVSVCQSVANIPGHTHTYTRIHTQTHTHTTTHTRPGKN